MLPLMRKTVLPAPKRLVHTKWLIRCVWEGQKLKGYPAPRLRAVMQIYHSKIGKILRSLFSVEQPGLGINMEEKKLLTVGTLNVKNIVTNEVYLREL